MKYNPNELSGLISCENLADLTTRINNVLISLKELPVDYNSKIES
ncbi:Imm3 family immunity protein [Paenibacillus rhizoplanae]